MQSGKQMQSGMRYSDIVDKIKSLKPKVFKTQLKYKLRDGEASWANVMKLI